MKHSGKRNPSTNVATATSDYRVPENIRHADFCKSYCACMNKTRPRLKIQEASYLMSRILFGWIELPFSLFSLSEMSVKSHKVIFQFSCFLELPVDQWWYLGRGLFIISRGKHSNIVQCTLYFAQWPRWPLTGLHISCKKYKIIVYVSKFSLVMW